MSLARQAKGGGGGGVAVLAMVRIMVIHTQLENYCRARSSSFFYTHALEWFPQKEGELALESACMHAYGRYSGARNHTQESFCAACTIYVLSFFCCCCFRLGCLGFCRRRQELCTWSWNRSMLSCFFWFFFPLGRAPLFFFCGRGGGGGGLNWCWTTRLRQHLTIDIDRARAYEGLGEPGSARLAKARSLRVLHLVVLIERIFLSSEFCVLFSNYYGGFSCRVICYVVSSSNNFLFFFPLYFFRDYEY